MNGQKISRTKIITFSSIAFFSLYFVTNIFGFRWAALFGGVGALCFPLYYRTSERPWHSVLSPRWQFAVELVASFIMLFGAVYYWSRPDPIGQARIQASIERIVADMAKNMQSEFPIKPNEKTTLLSAKANKKDLYMYQRTDFSDDEIIAEKSKLKELAINSVCSKATLKTLLDAGMIWHNVQLGAENRELFDLIVTKKDCPG